MPYSGWKETAVLEMVRVGEPPQRPSKIDDTVWEFLRKCWSKDPSKRPSTSNLRCPLAILSSSQVRACSWGIIGDRATGEGDVDVQEHQSFVRQIETTAKLKYGNKEHTALPTKLFDTSGGHTWFGPSPFLLSLPSLSLTREQSGELVV